LEADARTRLHTTCLRLDVAQAYDFYVFVGNRERVFMTFPASTAVDFWGVVANDAGRYIRKVPRAVGRCGSLATRKQHG
jgi:hypothetical protein